MSSPQLAHTPEQPNAAWSGRCGQWGIPVAVRVGVPWFPARHTKALFPRRHKAASPQETLSICSNRSIGHRAGSQCRGTMTSLCGKKTCSCSQPRRPTHVGAHPCAELGPSSTRGPEGGRGSPGLDCTGECSTLTPSSQPRRPRAQRSLHPPHPNPTPSGLHGPSPHLQGGWVAPQQEHPHGGQGSGPTPTALQR